MHSIDLIDFITSKEVHTQLFAIVYNLWNWILTPKVQSGTNINQNLYRIIVVHLIIGYYYKYHILILVGRSHLLLETCLILKRPPIVFGWITSAIKKNKRNHPLTRDMCSRDKLTCVLTFCDFLQNYVSKFMILHANKRG